MPAPTEPSATHPVSLSDGIPGLPAIDIDPFCPMCGYSLVGLSRAVCPECGTDVAELLQSHATVPWLADRRGLLKRYADFWKTVWVTSFGHTRKTMFEVFHPVDYRRTRRFAWLAALHAWIGILLGVAYCVRRELTVSSRSVLQSFADGWTISLLAVQAGCILLFLVFLAGLPTYFFHTKQHTVALQNRLVGLAYLLAGPLAWGLPLMLAGIAACMFLDDGRTPNMFELWGVIAGGLLFAMLVFWYMRCVRSAITLLQGRWVPIAIGLPIWVVTLVFLLLGSISFAAGYLFVAIHTLFHSKL